MQDGFWHFNDQRMDLKFIVRTEDERWDIGNDLRANLETLGFSVTLLPRQFGPAIFTVYGTDPELFEWHLYTEGWGRGAPQRYDFGNINSMCSPWLGNMPGWQEVGFWQYESPELDELGQRIFTGDFDGLEERNRLYVETTEKCLEESVRIWVVTAVNNLPAVSDIEGITEDVISGPRSFWTLREAHIPGNTDELNVGNLWVWTNRTTWNPWAVSATCTATTSGTTCVTRPWPLTRSRASPSPSARTTRWRPPAPAPAWTCPRTPLRGTRARAHGAACPRTRARPARSRSTTRSTSSRTGTTAGRSPWRTSSTPSPRRSTWSTTRRRPNIEVSISTTSKPFTDTFRGFRITDDNRLEVYVDYWHFVDDYIAQYANISGVSMPWEVLAAMDDMVFEQRIVAYSDTAAARFNVDPISLVLDRFARLTRNTLRDFAEDNSLPDNVFDVNGASLVSDEEASERYAAAIEWFSDKGHMIISNGPYLLETFDSSAQFAQIQAFRDSGYPFKPGDLYYGKPPTLRITGVEEPHWWRAAG